MFDLNQLKGILDHYTEASAEKPPESVHKDFDDATQNAPPETLADGISHAFHSDQTPPFHQMVSQLFSSGNAQQQTGLINTLLSSLGPSGLASGGGMLSGLSSMLGQGTSNVTPAQAQRLSPEDMEQLAEHAHSRNPSIVEEISGFVAQHPGWFKTLGAGALTVAMSRMAAAHHQS